MKKLIDVQLPFFIPMWRRIAVVVWCYGWAAVEFATNSPFWGILFGAIAVYCTHQFFFAFDPEGKNKTNGAMDSPSDKDNSGNNA